MCFLGERQLVAPRRQLILQHAPIGSQQTCLTRELIPQSIDNCLFFLHIYIFYIFIYIHTHTNSPLCAQVHIFSPLILHVPHAGSHLRNLCSFSPLTLCASIKIELLWGQLCFRGYLHWYEIYAYFSSGFRNASFYSSVPPKICFSLLRMDYPSAAPVQKILLKSSQMSAEYFESTFKVAQFISHFCGHILCTFTAHRNNRRWKK